MAGPVRTHYSEAGHNGPPLVLCHGGGAGSSGEAGFGRIMPALGQAMTVFALDAIGGYGDTDVSFPASLGIRSRVEHLENFIGALGLDQLCVGGNSQGAWVAARYALLHPERVRKLILVASSTIAGAMGIQTPETEGMRALRSYDGTRDSMRRTLEALIWDHSQITDELVDRRQAAATRPGAAEARRTFAEGTTRFTSDPNLRLSYEMTHTLPRLNIPTIFIWGEEDKFAPPTLGRQLEPLLPNVRFHYVPRAGHQAQNDQPEQVAKIMLDFLTRN
jgi:pimeloyl-ACP methyl ester carboxylesterase